ncbi:Piwi-domain-containing protein [Schizopora paradoxa]|uniref:Piwi-domain-containing protein n=1 Tax=Schizopora paradoxa TaxID=27342 RepID=A0A0H2S681_9AGAM|nr:Piwi-domain-containing protein [Schizopora paradoxa]
MDGRGHSRGRKDRAPGRARELVSQRDRALSDTTATASASSTPFIPRNRRDVEGRVPQIRSTRSSSPSRRDGNSVHGSFRSGNRIGGGSIQVFAPDNAPSTIDGRLSSEAKLASFINNIRHVSDGSRVFRPGFGQTGAKISLRANFFAVKYPKTLTLYVYTVSIKPEVKTTEKRKWKRIMQLFEQSREWTPYVHATANDGAQKIISNKRLPNEPFSISVTYLYEGETDPRPDAQKYTIELENTSVLRTSDLHLYLKGDPSKVDYDVQPITSAFNIIASHKAARSSASSERNHYYFRTESSNSKDTFPLSNGLEAWKGFCTSIRPTFKQLMVNVNSCTSPFFAPNARLSDALLSDGHGVSPNALTLYGKAKVTTSHLGFKRQSAVKGFGQKPARETVFQCDELGGIVSVEQYFHQRHDISLLHATDVPVVNIGSLKKDIYVPAEICEIEAGQPFVGKLSDKETAKMIKYACNPPHINAEIITREGLPKLGLAPSASPIADFNIEVSSNMSVIPARILEPPTVLCRDRSCRVRDGSWDASDTKFHKAATLQDFGVLILSDGGRNDFRGEDWKSIVKAFLKKCRDLGMNVKLPPGSGDLPMCQAVRTDVHGHHRGSPRQTIAKLAEAIKRFPNPPKYLFVFLANQDPHLYSVLKTLCDTKLGIHTTCMLNGHVKGKDSRSQARYFSNVALKVNSKLGGVNHSLDALSLNWLKGSMLVGMDVTHPGHSAVRGTPSIAAVVASCDNDFMLYPGSLRLQDRWKDDRLREMISDVKGMMIERLNLYKTKMKALPDRVLVFRDGVSEGQFHQVIEEELPGLREAVRAFDGYKPKITIVICTKQHNTRFYPIRTEDADRTGNTKAGTVVDQGVTGIYDFDYYLQAHAGLQGTVHPTHYTVIYDENHFAADDIQQCTNTISYLSACATRSLSVVPPAYWADQACDRARCYLHEILPPARNSPESRMTPEQIRQRAEELWATGVHDKLKDTMFYL